MTKEVKVTNTRRELDPCKKFMHTEEYPKLLIQAMGNLPSHLDENNPTQLLYQVGFAINLFDFRNNAIKTVLEIDKDGVMGSGGNSYHPIAIISRDLDGVYDAVFMYGDGSVIVQSDAKDIGTEFYYFKMSN